MRRGYERRQASLIQVIEEDKNLIPLTQKIFWSEKKFSEVSKKMAEENLEKRFFWTDEDIKKLPVLPEPVETFELETDESIKIQVARWE